MACFSQLHIPQTYPVIRKAQGLNGIPKEFVLPFRVCQLSRTSWQIQQQTGKLISVQRQMHTNTNSTTPSRVALPMMISYPWLNDIL
jgi:hypothetical protein